MAPASRAATSPPISTTRRGGLTSQGALYALFLQRHKLLYGTTDEQLGAVAVAFRKHACLNPNAVMQKPLTIEDYMKAPYIAEPLRLYDYCLINDGGAAAFPPVLTPQFAEKKEDFPPIGTRVLSRLHSLRPVNLNSIKNRLMKSRYKDSAPVIA